MTLPALPLLATVLALPLPAWACWDAAGARYGVAPALLQAIGRVESSGRADALNRTHVARTGSYDIGLMQINSRHLPMLARWGIREPDLLDACTNIHVGAWLLADAFARHGNNWNGVGAYHAGCTRLTGAACATARAGYAWRVYAALGAATAPAARPVPPVRVAPVEAP